MLLLYPRPFFYLFIICQLFLFKISFAQWELGKCHNAKGNVSLTSDDLGFFYLINDFELIKFNKNDTILFRYSDMRSGKIDHVDVSNPMKIIVFYRDFSKVVFLDNTLSERNRPIFLQEFDLDQTTLVANSYDNGLWTFDRATYSLIRFDKTFFISVRVDNLNKTLGIKEPTELIEKNNRLYMNDPSSGIYIFDIFGGFIKRIPISDVEELQITGDAMLFKSHGAYYKYDLLFYEEFPITDLPKGNFSSMRIEKNKVAIWDGTKICFYLKK